MLNIVWPIFIIISIVFAFFSGNLKELNIRIENAYNIKETTSGLFVHKIGIIKFNIIPP